MMHLIGAAHNIHWAARYRELGNDAPGDEGRPTQESPYTILIATIIRDKET